MKKIIVSSLLTVLILGGAIGVVAEEKVTLKGEPTVVTPMSDPGGGRPTSP